MDKNSLKKLISESVGEVFANQAQLSGSLKEDLNFLKDYDLLGSKMVNGAKTWKFEFKTSDNSYVSHAFFVQYPDGSCKMRLEVDWKVSTKHNTAGAGKDFVMAYGPYENYSTMVSELNRTLTNNPMIGTGLYNDNNDQMLDREIMELLNRLKNKIGEIRQLNHPSLKAMVDIYEAIKDIPDNELPHFCADNFKGWLLKQGVIYKLQDLDKIPYYQSLGLHVKS